MFKTRTGKIVLVAILAVALIIAALFWISSQNEKTEEEGVAKTAIPSDSGELITRPINTVEPAQPTTATTTVTPYPGSGEFDWTRQPQPEPIEVDLTADQIQDIKTKDVCEISGLSDSWSSPIEKTICNSIKIAETQIVQPLLNLSCALQGAAFSQNYKRNITTQFINGRCYMFDR